MPMVVHFHIPATSHLGQYVNACWEVQCDKPARETILPKGIVEIIFNIGEPMNAVRGANETLLNPPLCFIQGINTKVIQVSYSGRQHLFGIKLKPNKLKNFLGINPGEIANQYIDLTLVNKRIASLWQRLKESAGFAARVKLLEQELPIINEQSCQRTESLCNLFEANCIRPFNSINTLSDQVYYSPRHLNRKTRDLYGVSTEELIMYKKFNHSVQLLHQKDESLTSMAYDAGFYDQAHFCKVFKSYSGLSPNQYRKQKSEVPFHMFDKV